MGLRRTGEYDPGRESGGGPPQAWYGSGHRAVVGHGHEQRPESSGRPGKQFPELKPLQSCTVDRSGLSADPGGAASAPVFKAASGYPEGVCGGVLPDPDGDRR